MVRIDSHGVAVSSTPTTNRPNSNIIKVGEEDSINPWALSVYFRVLRNLKSSFNSYHCRALAYDSATQSLLVLFKIKRGADKPHAYDN